ncbi:hypothetical protein H4R19_006609 [Coemansia spiralis]|nr:hypothetical protein H4R19_006609 [Coemansia spiralis]
MPFMFVIRLICALWALWARTFARSSAPVPVPAPVPAPLPAAAEWAASVSGKLAEIINTATEWAASVSNKIAVIINAADALAAERSKNEALVLRCIQLEDELAIERTRAVQVEKHLAQMVARAAAAKRRAASDRAKVNTPRAVDAGKQTDDSVFDQGTANTRLDLDLGIMTRKFEDEQEIKKFVIGKVRGWAKKSECRCSNQVGRREFLTWLRRMDN